MKLTKKFYTGIYLFLAGITILVTLYLKKEKTTIIDNGTITQIDITEQIGNLSFGSQRNIGFTNFDTEVLEFIGEIKGKESFMVSPISFKAALTMLTIGANGDTQKKLLDAIGYSTSEDYLNRAINLKNLAEENNKKINEYNELQEKYNNGDLWGDKENNNKNTNRPNSFMIANSIWHNSDQEGKFTEQYKENIAKIGGIFGEVPGNKLHTQINERVNKYTNGLIPTLISQPIPDANTVLVNTTYLKSSWTKAFEKYATKPGDFTTIDGKTVQKDLMHKSDSYLYYEDKDCQILTIKLQGGFAASFVLGDSSDILKKIQNSTNENVKVTLPKFELETDFSEGELVTFLKNKGLGDLFNPNIGGDFSNMIQYVQLHIDDIIQKTKIELNEDGLEAAAATAIIMYKNTAVMEQPKYKEFTANKPFQFYIYTDDNEVLESQLLFYGQIIQ